MWLLVAASFVFYGYWEVRLVPLLAASIALNWLAARHLRAGSSTPVAAPPAERAAWRIPGTELLRDLLADLPDDTRVLLFFVPYHAFHQPLPGTYAHARWRECRARVVAAARARPGTRVIDFMVESPLTTRDEHYWDPLHFNATVAESVDAALAGALRDASLRHPAFTWLHPR